MSAANLHDSQALKPMLMAVPRIRSRRGPRRFRPAKLHGDKAYDIDHSSSGTNRNDNRSTTVRDHDTSLNAT